MCIRDSAWAALKVAFFATYNWIANLILVGQKIKIPADTQAAQSFKKGDKVKVLKAVTVCRYDGHSGLADGKS